MEEADISVKYRHTITWGKKSVYVEGYDYDAVKEAAEAGAKAAGWKPGRTYISAEGAWLLVGVMIGIFIGGQP